MDLFQNQDINPISKSTFSVPGEIFTVHFQYQRMYFLSKDCVHVWLSFLSTLIICKRLVYHKPQHQDSETWTLVQQQKFFILLKEKNKGISRKTISMDCGGPKQRGSRSRETSRRRALSKRNNASLKAPLLR